jgi:hypothetical protein
MNKKNLPLLLMLIQSKERAIEVFTKTVNELSDDSQMKGIYLNFIDLFQSDIDTINKYIELE